MTLQQNHFRLAERGAHAALIDIGRGVHYSYRALATEVEAARAAMQRREKALIALLAERDVGAITCYLAALEAGHAIYLSPQPIDHFATVSTIDTYRPEIILTLSGTVPAVLSNHYRARGSIAGYRALERIRCEDPPPHPALAVVLSTSASTGSSKCVRISFEAVRASARQVMEALRIDSSERVFASLPVAYVYGLSVVNSHLHAGATLAIDQRSMVDTALWKDLAAARITSLPGVSSTYELMRDLRFDPSELRTLRKLTHSGDRIPAATVTWLQTAFASHGANIFLMYGQTEATGRISVLPPELFPERASSVGRVVPDGELAISADGEVLFRGPNVMLGYAQNRADLSHGADVEGWLHTGDLGFLDSDGLLCLTGRRSRVCKILGRRVCLDEVEAHFHDIGPVAALALQNGLVLFFVDDLQSMQKRVFQLAVQCRLPPQCISLQRLSVMPRTQTGKISYPTLEILAAERSTTART